MVSNGSGVWWWAKSCSKPSYEISTEEYKLINHTFKYPGVAIWNDVTLSIVDVGKKADELYTSLLKSGYSPKADEIFSPVDGIAKTTASNLFKNAGSFQIQQLDPAGTAIEAWTLVNPFIKSTNFGQLDYSSDELVTLELVISYDYAILE
tara:strand:+ start:301 stop:750 length:450 start_codon:yes stop_codon:yes gene_type:complete